jgi:hypothetical protein
MDILERLLNKHGEVAPPPHGPRTQGGTDVVALEDERRVQSLPSLRVPEPEDGARVEDVVATSPILTALVAFHEDGLLVCGEERMDGARSKWVRDIKEDYKGLRLTGKRPWPEFFAALVSGGLRKADCEAVYNLRRIAVVTHECFPYEIGGAPLDTEVVDAHTGNRCTLQSLCVVKTYDASDDKSVREAAAAMFLNPVGPLATLLSKMATRAQRHTPLSGSRPF